MSGNTKQRVTLRDKTFEICIPHDKLCEAIDSVAQRINDDYKHEDIPIFIGVLNGSFMFFSELMQRIDFPCEVSFVKLASYQGTTSTGVISELLGLKDNISGRHVIIVEDIIDTGQSIEYLLRSLKGHEPASVAVATMLFKPAAFTKSYDIRYRAMDIPNDFIVGFGLDYDQLGRNLRDIYKLVSQ